MEQSPLSHSRNLQWVIGLGSLSIAPKFFSVGYCYTGVNYHILSQSLRWYIGIGEFPTFLSDSPPTSPLSSLLIAITLLHFVTEVLSLG